MDSEKNVLKMSPHDQKLLDYFKLWAIDASSFLSGDVVSLFSNFFKPDEMFNFLLLPNNEIDSMTKQCLEITFADFVVVSKRMLADHLKGGKLELNSEHLSHEANNVLATNSDSERDNGMLDRLMKLKHKALDIVYEGNYNV